MQSDAHRARRLDHINACVLTVSDTRTPLTDKSGPLIRRLLETSGHQVISYNIIPDEPQLVRERILACCQLAEVHVVLLTGGTGITARDSTYEAVDSLLEKRLDGFGELFRSLSYQEIGAAAMLSRATAGVCHATTIFSMPGSEHAVRLAMDQLILPELGHLIALIRKPTVQFPAGEDR